MLDGDYTTYLSDDFVETADDGERLNFTIEFLNSINSSEMPQHRLRLKLDFVAGTFYVQLEDDILAKPSFVTEMKKFAIEKIARKEPWFVLDFCQLGFIDSSDLLLVLNADDLTDAESIKELECKTNNLFLRQ
nr:unnamed protein product [Callosobruchus analis]